MINIKTLINITAFLSCWNEPKRNLTVHLNLIYDLNNVKEEKEVNEVGLMGRLSCYMLTSKQPLNNKSIYWNH